jgi:hypothetical protein
MCDAGSLLGDAVERRDSDAGVVSTSVTASTVDLRPVDTVEVLVLVDNVSDALLASTEVARRLVTETKLRRHLTAPSGVPHRRRPGGVAAAPRYHRQR